jgi:hypothetical protein
VIAMYNGYTESAEKIAARKARILKGYTAPKRAKKSKARKPSGSLEDA